MVSITLKLVADVIIALVAVWVIISIFQTFMPNVGGQSFCKFYQVVLTLPLPSFLKPNIQQCNIQPTIEKVTLPDSEKTKVTDDIESYIYKCWHEKASDGSSGITFPCYELFFSNIAGPVSERDVTSLHSSKNLCISLPNNFLDFERASFSCGNLNEIYWNVQGGTFNGTYVTVAIGYNGMFSQHRVEVS
jgi:hypothetical protein